MGFVDAVGTAPLFSLVSCGMLFAVHGNTHRFCFSSCTQCPLFRLHCMLSRNSGCVICRRSARLAARAQSTQLDSHSSLLTSEVNNGGGPYGATDDDDDPDHPWCFCQQPSDGKFMIMCDQQGENCFQWYRGACVDVSPAEGNLMSESGEPFVCSMCSGSPTLPSYTPTSPPNFCGAPQLRERISVIK